MALDGVPHQDSQARLPKAARQKEKGGEKGGRANQAVSGTVSPSAFWFLRSDISALPVGKCYFSKAILYVFLIKMCVCLCV